jgi:hypothetical protein
VQVAGILTYEETTPLAIKAANAKSAPLKNHKGCGTRPMFPRSIYAFCLFAARLLPMDV